MVHSNLGGQGGRCVDTTYRDGTSVAWSEEPDVAFWARLPPSLSVADTHEDIVLKMTGRPRPVEAAAAAAAAASPAGVSSVADDSLSAVSVSVSEDKTPPGTEV